MLEVSNCTYAMATKKCTKKCDTHAEPLLLLTEYHPFLTFSSFSSLPKIAK